jgi:AraC family transcriptional regulator
MLNSSSSFGVLPLQSFADSGSQNLAHNAAALTCRPTRRGNDEGIRSAQGSQSADHLIPTVKIAPRRSVHRSGVMWSGMGVEVIHATTTERLDFSFHSSMHLLAAYQQGVRRDGESYVDDLTRSTLRDVAKKLTFVPAGLPYREWQDPVTSTRVTYIYFDPEKLKIDADEGFSDRLLLPRLFFEDATIWNTVEKFRQAVEAERDANRPYIEALGTVLLHDLGRLYSGTKRSETAVKGGLAAWQQRSVTAYIEQHLSEQIPLATLARLVRLSTFHFCRAFKQSFGVPPHRYHTNRRIERAKVMLAERRHSVTEIGLSVGFSETSSFTAVFRKLTGQTPSRYHRALG